MEKVRKYINEVLAELKKVDWPSRNEVVKLTLIVLSISGIIAIYVGVLDLGFTKLLEAILSK